VDKAIDYKAAGVDTAAGAAAVDLIRQTVQSTYRPEVVGDIGGFGGLFSAAALKDMADPLLVSGTDGVGTKLALAAAAGRLEGVGIDLVAMCVNDVLVCGAEPLFFLDYIAIGQLDPHLVSVLVAGVAEGCRQAGCALIGGEMAEHPGVMAPGDFDLSGFCVGVVDRPRMVDGSAVAVGDVVLGLPSSGLHSNGFSLVRRVLGVATAAATTPAAATAATPTTAPATPAATPATAAAPATPAQSSEDGRTHSASAPLDLHEARAELGGLSLAEAALTPTRIYVPVVRDLLAAGLPIHGMAHITGGGITENLNRVLPAGCDALIEVGSWDVPDIIQFIVRRAGLDRDAAYRTFNMGIGFALIVDGKRSGEVRDALLDRGEVVYEIGTIVEGTDGAGAPDSTGAPDNTPDSADNPGAPDSADNTANTGKVRYLS
jgi:phosphoribosylformylglycinamidine cyclo-ligase